VIVILVWSRDEGCVKAAGAGLFGSLGMIFDAQHHFIDLKKHNG
jgi:hypothetical protein